MRAASALLLSAALAAACGRAPAPRTAEVRWTNGRVELAGTLHLPDAPGPHPAAVFVPGYGDWTRDEQIFRVHAERLARNGLAVLVYDKRGCGASSGAWRHATLADLAGDALGAHALLRADARIDADRVGLLGTSQGGLIAALAAEREERVAFVATLSLSLRTPAQHDTFLAGERVRRAGFGEDAARTAEELHRIIVGTLRAGDDWSRARAAAAEHADAPWLDAADVVLLPPDEARWRAYRDLPMDLSPRPIVAALDVPFFAAQGEADWVVPGPRDHAGLQAVRDEHARDFTLVLVPGAEHTLRVPDGNGWTWPDAYWTALDAWLARVTEGAYSAPPRSGAGAK